MNRIFLFVGGVAAAVAIMALAGSLCKVSSTSASGSEPSAAAPSASAASVPMLASMAPHVPEIESVASPSGDDVAPDFSWTGADGASHALSDYRGKVVMVNFWATWCPPCRRELPDIVKVRGELASKGLEVIGISVGEDPRPGLTVAQHIGEFAASNNLTYPLLIANESVTRAYGGVESIPTTIFVDRKGRVAKVVNEMMSESEMREILASVL